MKNQRFVTISILALTLIFVSLSIAPTKAQPSSDWRLELKVDGETRDNIFVGMSENLENIMNPPTPPEPYVDWFIYSGGTEYYGSIVRLQSEQYWNIRLDVSSGQEVSFSWQDVESHVPDNISLYLEVSGERINLRSRDNYGPIHFEEGIHDLRIVARREVSEAVATKPAYEITKNSAVLNMTYNFSGYNSGDVRFEWRRRRFSWNTTNWTAKSGSGSHSKTITGLSPGKKYEYRAQVRYGDIQVESGSIVAFTTANETNSTSAPPPEELENMTPENAFENLVTSDPASAARRLENMIADNAEHAAMIVDAGVKENLVDNLAPCLNRMDTESVANLLKEVFNLPHTPKAAAELLLAMNSNKRTLAIKTLIDSGDYGYVDGMFSYLSGDNVNDIYEELSEPERGELYPELSETVRAKISPDLAPSFQVGNLSMNKTEVKAGETITIFADVKNMGGTPYSYTARLSIDGEVVDKESVTLNPGQSKSISFDVSRQKAGFYKVSVGEETVSFEVMESSYPTTVIIAATGIIAIIVLVFSLWYRGNSQKGGL